MYDRHVSSHAFDCGLSDSIFREYQKNAQIIRVLMIVRNRRVVQKAGSCENRCEALRLDRQNVVRTSCCDQLRLVFQRFCG